MRDGMAQIRDIPRNPGRVATLQLVQYFARSFTICQVLNTIVIVECFRKIYIHVQQWNLFTCQTSVFYLLTCCPNYLNTYPIDKEVSACFLQKAMLAVVQATGKQLMIAPPYLMRISAHSAFSSLAQKDDSHWGLSPEYVAGVVTLLTPVCTL